MSEEQVDDFVEGVLMPAGVPATEIELIDMGESMGMTLQRLKISTTKELEAASDPMREAAGHKKMLEEHRKEHLSPVRTYVEMVNAEYKRATDAIDNGMRHAKSEMSAFQHKVEQERRKLAQAEAARIAKNAEKRAERAEVKGDEGRAEEIRMEAEMEAENAKAAVTSQAAPKAAGVSSRKNWKIEVTDLIAFAGAIVAGNDPRLKPDMLKVNQPVLNKLVKALEGGCSDIPGVRVFYEDVVSVRSK
jgi:hypothetical protein